MVSFMHKQSGNSPSSSLVKGEVVHTRQVRTEAFVRCEVIFRHREHSKTERKAGETKKEVRERESNTPVRQETEKGEKRRE